MNREKIMTALFNLLVAAPTGKNGFRTTGRRLLLWSAVAAQPALFLRDVRDEYPPRAARGLPAKVTIHAEIWIYVKVGEDPKTSPGAALNVLIDAIEAALQPTTAAGVQTLGGAVSHCWIEGNKIGRAHV